MEIREVEYLILGVGTAGLGAFSRIRKKTDSLLLIQHGALRHDLCQSWLHAE